ncbi:MAG: hypothetical protein A3I75_06850 [Deltaproteobacteria bacterium RIFCSPLOWO2_02_FULL_50_16]|nr:MAG: hypothetical protein A3B79_02780 [Deltaproteobacteria bacterium RIFCSPHIGHO2_02_FULL_50_15]OGQ57197.1 MAG: hypothetical protein A3I75_06850 [Deltaproteobacteria bacterium RIFCSPLOWO2_02_FULL_50_16]OGQ66287.1 MAG: hypothetical protein A3F89_01690 [Deltaproteobacteria bacterium RIFCSPLOWO2_12_FULL_50_11]
MHGFLKDFSRILIVIVVFFFSRSGFSWNDVDHRMVPRLALKSLISTVSLDPSVPYESFSSFIAKLGQVYPRIQTEDDFYHWLISHPDVPFEKKEAVLKEGIPVSPLEVLSQLSVAPDDGRDQDLVKISDIEQRKRISHKIFWFGGMTSGINSQAFRHIEKPPFSLIHPLETFGFPLTALGEATQRVEIYYLLALLADRLDSPYWAWQFLACSFHYLQDLHNPYHTTQIPPQLLWAGLLGYIQWGYQHDKGLLKTIGQVGANVHHFFEAWVSSYTGPYYPPYLRGESLTIPLRVRLLLRSLEGESTLNIQDIHSLAVETRDQSNLQSLKLTNYVLDLTGTRLLGPQKFPEGASAEALRDFILLEALKDRDPYEAPLWPLLRERFHAMGEALRQEVLLFDKERHEKKDTQLLIEALNRLLPH